MKSFAVLGLSLSLLYTQLDDLRSSSGPLASAFDHLDAVQESRDHRIREYARLMRTSDLLWIGARTTPDPFAVQALADSLAGTDLPVLVKNPVSPDVELWLGAIERLHAAGVRKIAAIHRGFSTPYQTR